MLFGNLGTVEILIVSFVLVGIFGSKKVKELARGLGESQRELKKIRKEYEKAVNGLTEDEEDPKSAN